MTIDRERFEAQCRDLEAAVARLSSPLRRDPMLWDRRRPGKWSAGQIVDHVAKAMAISGAGLTENSLRLRDGRLTVPPRRGLRSALIWWVIDHLIIRRGKMPRGGPTARLLVPSDRPEPAETLAWLDRVTAAHRAAGAGLDAAALSRLWTPNPVYGWAPLPEILALHTIHAHHHAAQIEDLAARG